MKGYLHGAVLLAAILLAAGCGSRHFISDKTFRQEADSTLQARAEAFGPAWNAFFAPEGKLSGEEKEALGFLYAYMPAADLTDYPTSYHLDMVRAAFRARKEMGWDVPEELFRHFVLPVRVNNESLDSARTVFYRELAPRVKGLPMAEAILEVNHWCHENVTYHPSDGRTSSPMATVRNTEGRCGEESVVLVTALRSVGIPARQVYTPRWAHSDDNHAWVEAWADGTWHFLGACEPEAVLDLGWFNAPASRCMFTHTKVFGRYHGPEEVVLQGPNYTEINLIGNYARTAAAKIRVLGPDGKPAAGARVDFCIYNYAEFYPAVSRYTEADGTTTISSGLGDLLAWASKDDLYGYARISFGMDPEVEIRLSDTPPASRTDLEIVPPPEKARFPEVTPEQRAANGRRLAAEDSLRNARMKTFPTPESAEALAASLGYGPSVAPRIALSKSNLPVLRSFLEQATDHERAAKVLEGLSGKDLGDVSAPVLQDAYDHCLSPGTASQRVSNEFLTPYRGWFLEKTGDRFRTEDPVAAILAWTRDSLTIDRTPGRWNITQSPAGVWQSRITDPHSRDIFFVSLARTFGTEARIDPVTGKVQYRSGDAWTDVRFDGTAPTAETPKGTLRLLFTPTGKIQDPGYYSNFTISRISGGRPHLLSFDEGEVDMGGGTHWAGIFRTGVTLDAGEYILVSGARRGDGSVPATLQHFTVREGQRTDVELVVKEDTGVLPALGKLTPEVMTSLAGYFAKKPYAILGCIGPGEEPTVHAVNDLVAAGEDLAAWGGDIVLITTQSGISRMIAALSTGKFKGLPKNVSLAGDDSEGLLHVLEETFKVGAKAEGGTTRRPYFTVVGADGSIYFLSEGYVIGLGDRLAAALKRLP